MQGFAGVVMTSDKAQYENDMKQLDAILAEATPSAVEPAMPQSRSGPGADGDYPGMCGAAQPRMWKPM